MIRLWWSIGVGQVNLILEMGGMELETFGTTDSDWTWKQHGKAWTDMGWNGQTWNGMDRNGTAWTGLEGMALLARWIMTAQQLLPIACGLSYQRRKIIC